MYTAEQKKVIAKNCFLLPKAATSMEGFVGAFMVKHERSLDMQMKEDQRERVIKIRKAKDDSLRVVKLIQCTIFRDVAQIMKDLSLSQEEAEACLHTLIVARKIRRVTMGGRNVYCMMK